MRLSSRTWKLARETVRDWNEDKAPRLAAALAYYTTFSVAPLLIVVIAIAGLFFGEEAVRGQIERELTSLIGEESAALVETMIAGAHRERSGAAAVLGVLALVFGATGVFAQLQDALNTVWEVAPKPSRGFRGLVKSRLQSFTLVLGIGFLLMVSLVISAAIAGLAELLGQSFEPLAYAAQAISFVASFAVITLLFAMIFKVLPDVEIAWRDVWVGAAATAFLFAVGKLLIGLYLGRSALSSTYGATAALAIFLLWNYYSAQILLLGAEFTQVYARHFGSRIVPDDDAVAITPHPSQEGVG